MTPAIGALVHSSLDPAHMNTGREMGHAIVLNASKVGKSIDLPPLKTKRLRVITHPG
jgi:hypothetical protein